MNRTLGMIALVLFALESATAQVPVVEAEEDVYSFVNPNNGSGPLWCYGCTQIVRLGSEVAVSQMETGENTPRLCNTRWRILRRDGGAWSVYAEADGYRQREPCPVVTTGDDTLYLYVNDSLMPPGAEYKESHPHLLKFVLGGEAPRLRAVNPVWGRETYFTDHSYRGFGADRSAQELLMMNINAKTGEQHWALIDRFGVTVANGAVAFPIRACYPQVAARGGAGHVMAIGDIVEPVEEWRRYKREQTGQNWDYVFRILYYAWTPNLREQEFSPPLELANVDATGGAISNQDLWIGPDGAAYCMYTEREVQSALLRDKFFPGKSIINSLYLAIVKEGAVVERRVLLEGSEERQPGHARFHETADGRLLALIHVTGADGGNKLLQVYPKIDEAPLVHVPFTTPFGSFTLASVRAGNLPSNTIDVFGHRGSGTTMSYGRIELK